MPRRLGLRRQRAEAPRPWRDALSRLGAVLARATPARRAARSAVAAAVLLLALATLGTSCAARGRFAARLTQEGMTGARPLTANWTSDSGGASCTLTLTMPEGERFHGRCVRIGLTTTPDRLAAAWGGWVPWQPYWPAWGRFGTPWVEGEGFPTFLQNYYGRIVATLFGDRGSAMRCRLALPEPEASLADGAVGECQLQDGRRIALQTIPDDG